MHTFCYRGIVILHDGFAPDGEVLMRYAGGNLPTLAVPCAVLIEFVGQLLAHQATEEIERLTGAQYLERMNQGKSK